MSILLDIAVALFCAFMAIGNAHAGSAWRAVGWAFSAGLWASGPGRSLAEWAARR